MRTKIAVFLGKSIAYFSRLLNFGGGSAAPGLYALKIDPGLIEKLVKNIPKNIIITGTNGKTTTSRMIAHIAKTAGLDVIRNHTGSNLERGIASTLILGSRLTGGKADLGIWELDEAAFNRVAPKIRPDIVVFLNVFRDQLDRYGEVNTIVKNWCRTVEKLSKNTILLVNGDDGSLDKLKDAFKGKAYKFGVKGNKITGEAAIDANKGGKPDFEAKDIKLNGLNGSRFSLIINHQPSIINLPLPGVYHIYDTVAALGVAGILNFPLKKVTQSLKTFKSAFGRVEKFGWGYIFLIKNPVGATAVFETISSLLTPDDRLLLALNDNLADGTDVSWIWDANFENLQPTILRARASEPRTRRLQTVCSGSRAYDLANRLKYSGFDAGHIAVESNLKKAFRSCQDGLKGRLFILPTYTAMLELQKILAKSGEKSHYWKEEL